ISLLRIVASSSAFRLPASPPPKGSSIDSDWSTKNKKHPGFLRLISAWYAMVVLHFSWHHENDDSHMPEVTGWSPVATIPRMQLNVSVNPSPDLNQGWRGRVGASPEGGCTIANSPEEFHDSAAISATTCRRRGLRSGKRSAPLPPLRQVQCRSDGDPLGSRRHGPARDGGRRASMSLHRRVAR